MFLKHKLILIAAAAAIAPALAGCDKPATTQQKSSGTAESMTKPVDPPSRTATGPDSTSGGLGGNPSAGTPGGAATAGPSDGPGAGSGTSGTNEAGTAGARTGSETSVPAAPPETRK
jgi:hypothetical protein